MIKKQIIVLLGIVAVMLGMQSIFCEKITLASETMVKTNNLEVLSDTDYKIAFLKEEGILIGDENGNLNLDKTLKRQEMIVIISRLMGKESEAKNWDTSNLTFNDVDKNDWAAPYIAWAKDNNITKGYSADEFGYDYSLTLTQTQLFILRTIGYDPSVDFVNTQAENTGIMYNVKNMNIEEIIRSDVAIMLYNAKKINKYLTNLREFEQLAKLQNDTLDRLYFDPCGINEEGMLAIHIYEIVKDDYADHTSTYNWYYIDIDTGIGTNILGEKIDLNIN